MNRSEAEKILGVNSNATPEEIKKAYRKKAMSAHPDREGGSEAEFKKLQEAFDYLENPPKQNSNYNQRPNSNKFDEANWTDFFGQSNRKNRFRDEFFNHDVNRDVNLTITLEEAFNGGLKVVNLKLVSGKIASVTLSIPPGIRQFDLIKRHEQDGEIYDIRAVVHTVDSKSNVYEADLKHDVLSGGKTINGDITRSVNVPVFKMITGGWEEIRMIDGSVIRVRIPEGQDANSKLKIRGKGYWHLVNGTSRGDCYVKLVPDIKRLVDLDSEQLKSFMSAIQFELFSRDKNNTTQETNNE